MIPRFPCFSFFFYVASCCLAYQWLVGKCWSADGACVCIVYGLVMTLVCLGLAAWVSTGMCSWILVCWLLVVGASE